VLLFFTVCSYAESEFRDVELKTNGRIECDITDPFYAGTCPTGTLKIIPKMLGLLIGDRERLPEPFSSWHRGGTKFDVATVVKWESDSIEVLNRHIFFQAVDDHENKNHRVGP